jgi:hypothetical protein
MGDKLALHREGMTYQHQPYSPTFKVRQNNPYSAIVFVHADEESDSEVLKKSQSAEILEGSIQTYAGISPSASSRSTSIQTGNSPIEDITVYALPSYEEACPIPSYEEALTTLPPAYTVTQ